MNLRQAWLDSIAVLWLLSSTAQTQASSEPIETSRANRTVVLRTSDLRSAYLIRGGQVRYDANDTSAASLRLQLQRHFDTVVALLMLNSAHSVELALNRLEAQSPSTWSAAERAEWRGRLVASRRIQIARLIDYRQRGRFPQNEGRSPQAIPIFVDNHNTACAVGHLMRLSGSERDVAAIQRD